MARRIVLVTGPREQKPSGYVNGPVASSRLVAVAAAASGDIGSTTYVTYASIIS